MVTIFVIAALILLIAPAIVWTSLNVIEEVNIKGWAKFRTILYTFLICYTLLIIMCVIVALLI